MTSKHSTLGSNSQFEEKGARVQLSQKDPNTNMSYVTYVPNFLNLWCPQWDRNQKVQWHLDAMVSAGGDHTVLLRSDGQAVACGSWRQGQCSIPPLDEGLSYSQVSAGSVHTVLLRSDGQAVACGYNYEGQCGIPPLKPGLSYSQVSAGGEHTVLLRSDGQAVACGRNREGQCSIPPLDEGLSYSQVSAGSVHTVLLRSDGQAVACGWQADGRCSIPPLDFHTARFLQELITQCFSEVMVKPLLAAGKLMGDAAYHPWMKDFHTARFLQEGITQCFSEVMVKLLLAALEFIVSATFQPWMKDFHTARFLQDMTTQCFSEVMVKPWPVPQNYWANATFQHFHHCGLGVTCFLVALQLRVIATFVTFPSLGKTMWCKWIFFLRVMQASYWLVLDWMGWRCYDWKHKNLTEQWMFAAVWLMNWTQTPRIFEWFCLMRACLVQSLKQIHSLHFLMWCQCDVLEMASVLWCRMCECVGNVLEFHPHVIP